VIAIRTWKNDYSEFHLLDFDAKLALSNALHHIQKGIFERISTFNDG
jgi:hypothetical protein